jgi:hypothetical protein
MKAPPVRLTAIAAVLLMGLACTAGARQAGASGRAVASTVPRDTGQVTIAQTSTSQTGTAQAGTVPPAAAPASSSQPSSSQSSPPEPGTSDQNGGSGSGDDTGGSQPATGDQGSGTDSSSGAAASPPAPAQENPAPPPPLNPALDAQAKLLLQQLTAKQLDPRLPAMALPDWFAQQIGKRAEIDWTTGDCSDEADYSGSGSDNGGASGASYDPTLCTEGQALFYGPDGKASLDRYVVLQITVGSRQTGVNRVASTYGPDAVTVFVFDGSSTRTLSRLGDLSGALESMN